QGKTLRVLLDGAHNEAGVAALQQALIQGYPRRQLRLIWGNMADKQMQSALLELMQLTTIVIFTQAESLRSAAPTDLQAQIPEPARAQTRCAETVEQALKMALTNAQPDDLICVAGSLYLVGRMRQLILRDYTA
ncbi:MAG: bifunctional folylpolyglutamate synthase/dihydrofolate synthase, partial [Desulfobulbaceae bacterium]|nr:bifunctional folylpolyglutamate synthase/dihydrofolate synthase [Desulfobulbaceae bacterium]